MAVATCVVEGSVTTSPVAMILPLVIKLPVGVDTGKELELTVRDTSTSCVPLLTNEMREYWERVVEGVTVSVPVELKFVELNVKITVFEAEAFRGAVARIFTTVPAAGTVAVTAEVIPAAVWVQDIVKVTETDVAGRTTFCAAVVPEIPVSATVASVKGFVIVEATLPAVATMLPPADVIEPPVYTEGPR
jgi:hypothetical protein